MKTFPQLNQKLF